jgi:hypothetical protein
MTGDSARRLPLVAATLVIWLAFPASAPAQTVSFTARQDYQAGAYAGAMAQGDFNGDGRLDLAVSNGGPSPSVSVRLGQGDGTFQAAQSVGAVGRGPFAVAVGDFNGDAKPDLATANYYDDNVTVLLGNGDGTFQPPSSFGVGVNPSALAAGDFNGDGKLDLVVVGDGSGVTVSVLLGNGDGTFQVAQTVATGDFAGAVAVGDFNGDGKLDLAVPQNSTSAPVWVLLGNGDGTFQVAQTVAVGDTPGAVVVGDFNGDGKPDLAVVTCDCHYPDPPRAMVAVLLGQGDGTFQAPLSFAAGGLSSGSRVAVGDFDGDGVPDLAVSNGDSGANLGPSTDTVSVLLGQGDGTFQTPLALGTGKDPTSVTTGDFDGDGTLDLAVLNYTSGTVSVLLQGPPGPNTIWISAVNVTLGGTSLQKTSGCAGCWDAGTVSQQRLSGDGYGEFTATETDLQRLAGLAHAFTGTDPTTVDFAIGLQSGLATVWENGVYRADTPFVAGDVFRVAVQSGVVSYSQNGVVFYTSASVPTYPLFFAASLADLNATVTDAVMGGAL